MTISGPETLQQLRTIVQKRLPASAKIDDDAPLYSSGRLDSMSIIDLIMELEEAFGVSLPGAELQPDDLDYITKIAATIQRFR